MIESAEKKSNCPGATGIPPVLFPVSHDDPGETPVAPRTARIAGIALLLVVMCVAGPAAGREKGKGFLIGHSAQNSMAGLRLEIASERLFVGSSRYPKNVNFESVVRDHKGRTERHALSMSADMPSLEYNLSTSTESLKISMKNGFDIHIAYSRKGDARIRRFEFTQLPERPLSIVVETSRTPRRTRADTIWELLIVESDLCRQYLLPVLKHLRSGRRLVDDGQLVENVLMKFALTDRRQWDRLVTDLASRKFGTRRSAERKLQAIGPSIIPYLQGLDPQQLDAEQKHCVARIVKAVDIQPGFVPEKTAAALVENRRVWLALMSRPSENTRRLAARQLKTLLDEPLDFDPAADDAVRQSQLDRLKQRIVGRSRTDK